MLKIIPVTKTFGNWSLREPKAGNQSSAAHPSSPKRHTKPQRLKQGFAEKRNEKVH